VSRSELSPTGLSRRAPAASTTVGSRRSAGLRRRKPASEGKKYPVPHGACESTRRTKRCEPHGGQTRPRGCNCVRGRTKTLRRRHRHDPFVTAAKRVRGWREALFRQGRAHRLRARSPEEEKPKEASDQDVRLNPGASDALPAACRTREGAAGTRVPGQPHDGTGVRKHVRRRRRRKASKGGNPKSGSGMKQARGSQAGSKASRG